MSTATGWLGAAGAALLIAAAVLTPRGVDASGTPPTTVVRDGAPSRPSQHPEVPYVAEIRSTLPMRTAVEAVVATRDAGRSYDEVTLRAEDGSRFVLAVYQHFDATELDRAGLPRATAAAGTAWVGAADPDLTSVYFLSNGGTGLWLSHSAPPDRLLDVGALQRLAGRISERPAVIARGRAS